MKSKTFRIISILMLIILILALVTLTVGAIAKANLARQYPAPGQLVDVGGYKMHIHCKGQGSPTVILASGMSDFSVSWIYVQPEIAKDTRVCVYDRAGLGWSESGPAPRSASAMVAELHTLLVKAGIQGPYVLVGHSLGGLLAQMYAGSYPEEVMGVVLVDSANAAQDVRRSAAVPKLAELQKAEIEQWAGQFRMFGLLSSTGIMALTPQSIPHMGLPKEAYAQYQAVLATKVFFETAVDESSALMEGFANPDTFHIVNLGDKPLIVLSAGHFIPNPALSEAENQQIKAVVESLQTELTTLSSDSQQIIAKESGHFIQLDQPNLVIDAIREMIDARPK